MQLDQQDGKKSTLKLTEPLDGVWVPDLPENVAEPHIFAGNPGGNPVVTDGSNPLEIFQYFFTDEIVNCIVEQTNLFADQSIK